MKNSLVPELESDREVQKLYEEEGFVLEVTEAICELMQKQKIKRVELARRLGRDKSYVTQLLDGSSNMTLKTISDVLFCLDSRAKIGIELLQIESEEFSDVTDNLFSSEQTFSHEVNPYPRLMCSSGQLFEGECGTKTDYGMAI